MNATDVQPDRLDAAVAAAKTLAGKLPPTFRLGLVTFSDFAEQRASRRRPTTRQVKAALDQLRRRRRHGDGRRPRARAAGRRARRCPSPSGTGMRRLPAVIVLLSDGKNTVRRRSTRSTSPARPGRLHIPIYTVALGTRRRRDRAARPVRLPAASCARRRPTRGAARDRPTLRRPRVHAPTDADKLQSIYAGSARGCPPSRQARGHGRVRRRRARAAARRRRALAGLVRPSRVNGQVRSRRPKGTRCSPS